MPQFSIITVCLNAGEKLGHTIASVREQCFGDFEHVIKDGNSTDGSVERFVAATAVPRRISSPIRRRGSGAQPRGRPHTARAGIPSVLGVGLGRGVLVPARGRSRSRGPEPAV